MKKKAKCQVVVEEDRKVVISDEVMRVAREIVLPSTDESLNAITELYGELDKAGVAYGMAFSEIGKTAANKVMKKKLEALVESQVRVVGLVLTALVKRGYYVGKNLAV